MPPAGWERGFVSGLLRWGLSVGLFIFRGGGMEGCAAVSVRSSVRSRLLRGGVFAHRAPRVRDEAKRGHVRPIVPLWGVLRFVFMLVRS